MAVRNQSLDVLRAIAVLMVIVSHYTLYAWMQVGNAGVDLFFVLSGFLISGLLFREIEKTGTVSILRFYLRRSLKIYPAFYFFLAVTALLLPVLRPHWKFEVLFLQSYFWIPAALGPGWVHLWSLAVEEHFYIILPLLLVLLASFRQLRLVPILAAAYFVIAAILRYRFSTSSHLAVVWQSHLRADQLLAGVMLGYSYSRHPEGFRRESGWYLLPAGVLFAVAGALPGKDSIDVAISPTLGLVGYGLLLAWAVVRTLPLGPLAEIGRHSYSIYLWQMPIALLLRRWR
jgi:peptidoglycan/LPS O-acetylase OafA/YrhL